MDVGRITGPLHGPPTLDQTSETLANTLREYLAAVFDRETIDVAPLHTGGGCMVLQADLSQDGRGIGRALWLTREEDWILGFYDFSDPALDLTDGLGVCVTLCLSPADRDNPAAVAEAVAGILARLGVTTLQGG